MYPEKLIKVNAGLLLTTAAQCEHLFIAL